MNRNKLIGFAIAAAVFAALAFTAYSLFEIVPGTRFVPPSREARINEYLALDRWLVASGIPVRTLDSGDYSLVFGAAERKIFIQASLFQWDHPSIDFLIHWVEEGGSLILAMDYSRTELHSYRNYEDEWDDEGPMLMLEAFGIEVEIGNNRQGNNSGPWSAESPHYDRRISFEAAEGIDALSMKDWDNVTRLIQVKRGKGKLTVMGRPFFLLSEWIDSAPNSRLAWALFAADKTAFPAEADGCLFIRGTARVRGLFGTLFRQGNLAVLIISVLVLLIIVFWTVIPVFGLVRDNTENRGRTLRGRFLAEGRFLKYYGGLDHYVRIYVKEIKRRLAHKEGLTEDGEILKRVTGILDRKEDEGGRALLESVFRAGLYTVPHSREAGTAPFRNREFTKIIITLNKVLERI